MIDLDLNPGPRILKQFGFIALVGFGVLAVLAFTERWVFAFGLGDNRVTVAAALAGVGLLSAALSVVFPTANRPLYVALSLLAFPIGFVLSYLIMAVLFYVLIAPVAVLLRVTGQDPMKRRYDPAVRSYWSDARPPPGKQDYFKQY